MGSINVDVEAMKGLYAGGASTPVIARQFRLGVSAVRRHLLSVGVVLRSRKEAIRRLDMKALHPKGIPIGPFSDEHKRNISAARQRWAETHALGVRTTSNGYEEYTRGAHKGRSVHDVLMEETIGRRLTCDEHVHHIDGNKQNNNLDNLALMSRREHVRLHRLRDTHTRKRDARGRLC